MTQIRFLRDKKNWYKTYQHPQEDFGVWLFFQLIQYDFCGNWARDLLRENIMGPEARGCSGNCSDVEIKGERAIVSYQFTPEDREEIDILEVDRNHLVEIINKWQDLSDRDAKEIIVRRDGERFEIEGVFE